MGNSLTTKLKAYIGLAQRANAVLYGEDIIVERKHLVKLVLISSSATQKYKDRVSKKCEDCPHYIVDDLQECLHRDGINAIGLTNENLANVIIEILR